MKIPVVVVLVSKVCLALQVTRTAVTADTFKNPPKVFGPRFRYWLPDASADANSVVQDIEDASSIGASGLQMLGSYLYGGPPYGYGTYAPVDWTVYGWGTEAWREQLDPSSYTYK